MLNLPWPSAGRVVRDQAIPTATFFRSMSHVNRLSGGTSLAEGERAWPAANGTISSGAHSRKSKGRCALTRPRRKSRMPASPACTFGDAQPARPAGRANVAAARWSTSAIIRTGVTAPGRPIGKVPSGTSSSTWPGSERMILAVAARRYFTTPWIRSNFAVGQMGVRLVFFLYVSTTPTTPSRPAC